MIYILKRFLIIVFFWGIVTLFNSCSYVIIILMVKGEKTTVDEWKTGKYKTRIQRRVGWSGPHFYHCQVKVKKLGGLYYRTVFTKSFSREKYVTCLMKYPFLKDTIAVDVCNKSTFLIK